MGHGASRQLPTSSSTQPELKRPLLGLFRRGSAIPPEDGGPTHGQILRGHGPKGKKGGWRNEARKTLCPSSCADPHMHQR